MSVRLTQKLAIAIGSSDQSQNPANQAVIRGAVILGRAVAALFGTGWRSILKTTRFI
jgi:hypothetical protein